MEYNGVAAIFRGSDLFLFLHQWPDVPMGYLKMEGNESFQIDSEISLLEADMSIGSLPPGGDSYSREGGRR